MTVLNKPVPIKPVLMSVFSSVTYVILKFIQYKYAKITHVI